MRAKAGGSGESGSTEAEGEILTVTLFSGNTIFLGKILSGDFTMSSVQYGKGPETGDQEVLTHFPWESSFRPDSDPPTQQPTNPRASNPAHTGSHICDPPNQLTALVPKRPFVHNAAGVLADTHLEAPASV